MSVEPESYWQAASHWSGADALPATADVAVIGGGLLGTCTAYWLAKRGVRVALLEQQTLAFGATGRNGGFMVAGTAERYPDAIQRLGHVTARAVWQLTVANRILLRQALEDEQIVCEYREPGHVSLALGAAQLTSLAETVAALRADDFTAELLDRQQVQALVGTPLGAEIAGGLFGADDGLLQPARFIQGLANAARRAGALLCAGQRVTAVAADGHGVQITTESGTISAGAAVIAVNAWSADLAPGLSGVVTPVRGQVLAYEPLPPVFHAGLGAAVTPTGEYWQQTPDGTIVLGGCRMHAERQDVGERVMKPTDAVQSALEGVFPRLFPALEGLQVARRWAGLMAFTKDYLPIADRVVELPGVWAVGGFCGHGMPFGMVLGEALATAATSGQRPAALEHFRLDRPSLHY